VVQYKLELFKIWLLLFPIFSTLSFSLGKLPDITFNRVILLPMGIFILLYNMLKRKFEIDVKIFALILAFLLAAFYSSIRSHTPTSAFQMVIDAYLMPIIAFYIGVYFFKRGLSLISIQWIFIFIGLYVSFMGYFEFITHIDLFPTPIGLRIAEETAFLARSNGPFSTSETYGLFLNLCIFIIIYIQNLKIESWSRVKILAMVLMFLGMICSMNRGIAISFLVAYSFPFMFYSQKRIKLIFSFIFVLVIMLFLYSSLYETMFFERRISNYENIATRISAYLSALAIIRDHLIQGIGFLNFSIYSYTSTYNLSFQGYSHPATTHNAFLAIITEMGLIGFIPFIILVYVIIRAFRKSIVYHFDGNMTIFSIVIAYMMLFISDNLTTEAPGNYLFFFFLSYLYTKIFTNSHSEFHYTS
jgi:O-antigen ligase